MRAAIALLALLAATPQAAPMDYAAFRRVPQPPAPRTIAYGRGPLQYAELWRPVGRGPFPIVFMLHGGCWQSAVAKADIMHAAAADLVRRGIAVWNVEYRGVDVAGGGYPGTFRDVAAAADLLAARGPALGLDTRRIVAFGHSAGGHLALWAAARRRIPPGGALRSPRPAIIAGVVGVGALPDLAAARTQAAEACGADTIDRLVGPAGRTHPHPYADTSPADLLPIRVPATLISGALDPIAPPHFAAAYAAKARARGDAVSLVTMPGAGHFELILPGSTAWEREVEAIRALLVQPRPR
jgi:acetyl esterase/lipase